MSVQVENLEKNMAKLTIEVPVETMEEAMNKVYQRAKNSIVVPGFRKGKAPRAMVERMYGKGVFMEDAANSLIQEEYTKAAKESGLEITSRPKIDAVQLEPGKPFIFTAEVAVKPDVVLGDYKGLEIPRVDADVTDEDVDGEVKKEQEKNARTITVTNRSAQKDDTVKIDFEGFVDGEAFEGGKGTDFDLVLGSGTFIPGFEDQLIGANTGDHVEVNVTFPEEYQEKSLAGKAAVFQCDVKSITTRELPEADDEFAQEVSEFRTLDEYKQNIRKDLEKKKAEAAKTQKENAAVDKAIENAQMDIPEPMVETQALQMVDDFENRLRSQGLSMEQYQKFTGLTPEKLLEQMKPDALKRIQTRLVLEKIAEAENIEVTDEDLSEEIKKMAEMYSMEEENVRELVGEEGLETMKKDAAVQKAISLITDAAVEV